MKKRFLLPLVSAVLLSGCFSAPAPTHYYMLNLGEPTASPKQFPCRIYLQKTTIDQAYKRQNIVYRESPYEFMFYGNSLWASAPASLINQSIQGYFLRLNIVEFFESNVTARPDFELLSHVEVIEEVDEGENRFARIAIKFIFRKTDNEQNLWSKRYDQKRAYSGNKVKDMAIASSELLASYLDDVSKEIQKVLASIPESELRASMESSNLQTADKQLENAEENIEAPEEE